MTAILVQSEAITCPAAGCGLVFTVPERFVEVRRQDCKNFYCPNGHTLSFKTSELDNVRRERDRLKQDAARLEEERSAALREAIHERDRAVKAEAKAKRLTKRAAAGTCPCCHRTFRELAEHMKHEHADFVKETGAKVVPIRKRSAVG